MADCDHFELRLNDYLAEARRSGRRTLRLWLPTSARYLSSIKLRSRESVLVDFDGPDEDVYWSCEYADGKFSGLDYDS